MVILDVSMQQVPVPPSMCHASHLRVEIPQHSRIDFSRTAVLTDFGSHNHSVSECARQLPQPQAPRRAAHCFQVLRAIAIQAIDRSATHHMHYHIRFRMDFANKPRPQATKQALARTEVAQAAAGTAAWPGATTERSGCRPTSACCLNCTHGAAFGQSSSKA